MSAFAVGFDFDHTLAVDNKLERTVALEMAARLAEAHGVVFDASAAAEAFEIAIGRVRRGESSIESAVRGFLQATAGNGTDNEDVAGGFRDEVSRRAPEFVKALPGAREMLAELDALGVRYALLSNGWSPLQEEKARLIGFQAPVYVSERIGIWKPDVRAFELLARGLGVQAEMVWYVGDDPRLDCVGAKEAGMRAIWCDFDATGYPSGVTEPDAVIHSLAELPALLQGRLGGAAKPAG